MDKYILVLLIDYVFVGDRGDRVGPGVRAGGQGSLGGQCLHVWSHGWQLSVRYYGG